ncbi:Flp pilus assembly complex ATPase component TadA [Alcaligenaceae bacterium LF4-65]|uniref:Flp pilus assembly complex ATPase component TadA n=1 Tax=Zwartia hollandica TaxID=324606 RepID=A0A953NAH6_9BURK|nr:Flp pilus assembly complex ATPase component TadA [Zwartia hollandica]
MISQEYAQKETDAATVVDELEESVDLARLMQEIPLTQDLLELSNDAPIIRMINSLFKQASRDDASDIHLEAYDKQSVVRFRVDGNLRDVVDLKRGLHAALVSRIKIMASLDIAEKRMPQDGRISLRVGGKALDIRVSTLPTAHGERVVMRLLEKNYSKLDLKALGMAVDTEKSFLELINKPYGIVLVTGPTGSGKTTTLYSALLTLRSQVNNIMTVEDPIEYNLEGVGQTQVNSRIEMNFARALRAILRQDPDIVMIGEIRDLETAQIAVQASLTGHLVLATLHTNDAPSAVTRLIDMGIEPFLLSSSLLGVLGQRLIRLTCTACHGQGCADCTQTGFKGRAGIYELMTTSVELKELIHQNASEAQIRQKALESGMRSLVQDSERWVNTKMTTLAEVRRVTGANHVDI